MWAAPTVHSFEVVPRYLNIKIFQVSKYSRYPKRDFLKVSQNVGAAPAVHAVEAVPGARRDRAA